MVLTASTSETPRGIRSCATIRTTLDSLSQINVRDVDSAFADIAGLCKINSHMYINMLFKIKKTIIEFINTVSVVLDINQWQTQQCRGSFGTITLSNNPTEAGILLETRLLYVGNLCVIIITKYLKTNTSRQNQITHILSSQWVDLQYLSNFNVICGWLLLFVWLPFFLG